MAIRYNEKNRSFQLDTKAASYVIGVVDAEGFVGHAYFGKKLGEDDVAYLMRTGENPFTPETNARDRLSFLDSFPMEYPCGGVGDYRESAISVRSAAGHRGLQLTYESHRIYQGKKPLEGLPATWGSEQDTETLELVLTDKVLGLKAVLSYSIFEGIDAVVRSTKLINESGSPVYIDRILSAAMDMDNRGYDKILLHGSWARERHIDRTPVGYGMQGMSSLRGEEGHQTHPFMALLEKTATEDAGEVYGINLV